MHTIVNRGVKKKRALEKSALKKRRGEKRGGKENLYKKNVYKKKGGVHIHKRLMPTQKILIKKMCTNVCNKKTEK